MEVKIPKRKVYSLKSKQIAIRMMRQGWSIKEISELRGIPRSTLYDWLKLEKRGLPLINKRGRKEKYINPKFIELVVIEWNKQPRGSFKLWLHFKKLGFGVSQRQIQKILNKNKLKMNKRKRPKQIKFVKYEYSEPNELWHTDWTTCPYTGKQLIAFLDDYSRYIVHTEFFDKATTENTIIALKKAIEKHGKPKMILTDNGPQFTNPKNRGDENHEFTKFCKEQGVKHISGRTYHPQTIKNYKFLEVCS